MYIVCWRIRSCVLCVFPCIERRVNYFQALQGPVLEAEDHVVEEDSGVVVPLEKEVVVEVAKESYVEGYCLYLNDQVSETHVFG